MTFANLNPATLIKNPLAIFSSLVVVAAAALGITLWERNVTPVQPAMALAEVNEKPVAPKAAQPMVAAPAPPVITAQAQPVVAPPVQVATATASTSVEVAKPPQKPAVVVAPSFDTVSVQPTGEAVIAGRAAPGSSVVAKLNGAVIGTGQASADGSFVMVPEKPLASGTGLLTLEATDAGKTRGSDQTVAVSVKPADKAAEQTMTVAVLDPVKPTKMLEAAKPASKSVTLDAVDYDAKGNIVFSGRAERDAAVRLYVDNAPVGEAKSTNLGVWNFAATAPVAPGNHQLRADALTAEGGVASRVELPFTREEPAKVAEAAQPDPSAPVTSLTIQPGNNLWRISRQLYGQGRKYTVLYEANKDQIKNPRLIYPGQILSTPKATP